MFEILCEGVKKNENYYVLCIEQKKKKQNINSAQAVNKANHNKYKKIHLCYMLWLYQHPQHAQSIEPRLYYWKYFIFLQKKKKKKKANFILWKRLFLASNNLRFLQENFIIQKGKKSTKWALEGFGAIDCTILRRKKKIILKTERDLISTQISIESLMYVLCLLTKTRIHVNVWIICDTNTFNTLLLSISWNSLLVCANEMNENIDYTS